MELGVDNDINSIRSANRAGGDSSHRSSRGIMLTGDRISPTAQIKRVNLPESPADSEVEEASAYEGDTGDWSISMVETERSDHSGSVHHMSLDTSSEEEEGDSDDGDGDGYDFEIDFDVAGEISVI